MPLKVKVLKYKLIAGLFGVLETFNEDDPKNVSTEILQCGIPQLFGEEATMEDLKTILMGSTAFLQLVDYDLITMQLEDFNG